MRWVILRLVVFAVLLAVHGNSTVAFGQEAGPTAVPSQELGPTEMPSQTVVPTEMPGQLPVPTEAVGNVVPATLTVVAINEFGGAFGGPIKRLLGIERGRGVNRRCARCE